MANELIGARGLAIGTVQWGMAYGIANSSGCPDVPEVAAILDSARNAGVTILDTARAYGASEAVLGELVGACPDWKVFTKLAPTADSAHAAHESLERSRQALRRPILDGVLLHRSQQRHLGAGAIWDLLRSERDAGRIGQLGVSAGTPAEAWAALEDPEIACIQVASSLLDQRLSRAGFFEKAQQAGRTVFVRSVFLQGVAYLPLDALPAHLAPLRDPLAAIHAWSAAHGIRPGLAFLAFAAALPDVRVLIGCDTSAQFADNVRAWSKARDLAAAVGAVATAIPALPAEILNPASWPT